MALSPQRRRMIEQIDPHSPFLINETDQMIANRPNDDFAAMARREGINPDGSSMGDPGRVGSGELRSTGAGGSRNAWENAGGNKTFEAGVARGVYDGTVANIVDLPYAVGQSGRHIYDDVQDGMAPDPADVGMVAAAAVPAVSKAGSAIAAMSRNAKLASIVGGAGMVGGATALEAGWTPDQEARRKQLQTEIANKQWSGKTDRENKAKELESLTRLYEEDQRGKGDVDKKIALDKAQAEADRQKQLDTDIGSRRQGADVARKAALEGGKSFDEEYPAYKKIQPFMPYVAPAAIGALAGAAGGLARRANKSAVNSVLDEGFTAYKDGRPSQATASVRDAERRLGTANDAQGSHWGDAGQAAGIGGATGFTAGNLPTLYDLNAMPTQDPEKTAAQAYAKELHPDDPNKDKMTRSSDAMPVPNPRRSAILSDPMTMAGKMALNTVEGALMYHLAKKGANVAAGGLGGYAAEGDRLAALKDRGTSDFAGAAEETGKARVRLDGIDRDVRGALDGAQGADQRQLGAQRTADEADALTQSAATREGGVLRPEEGSAGGPNQAQRTTPDQGPQLQRVPSQNPSDVPSLASAKEGEIKPGQITAQEDKLRLPPLSETPFSMSEVDPNLRNTMLAGVVRGDRPFIAKGAKFEAPEAIEPVKPPEPDFKIPGDLKGNPNWAPYSPSAWQALEQAAGEGRTLANKGAPSTRITGPQLHEALADDMGRAPSFGSNNAGNSLNRFRKVMEANGDNPNARLTPEIVAKYKTGLKDRPDLFSAAPVGAAGAALASEDAPMDEKTDRRLAYARAVMAANGQ